MKISINKSIYPRYISSLENKSAEYGDYVNICLCISCGRVGQYEDFHIANPCPFCGGKKTEGVGRFIKTSKWYQKIFNEKSGYWIVNDNIKME